MTCCLNSPPDLLLLHPLNTVIVRPAQHVSTWAPRKALLFSSFLGVHRSLSPVDFRDIPGSSSNCPHPLHTQCRYFSSGPCLILAGLFHNFPTGPAASHLLFLQPSLRTLVTAMTLSFVNNYIKTTSECEPELPLKTKQNKTGQMA